jgi:Cu-Zn family superoxide dismutase
MKVSRLLAGACIAAAAIFYVSVTGRALAADAGPGFGGLKQAIAVLNPTANSKCRGVVHFTQEGDSLKVTADLEGLNPGQKHAFHIHQYGDCSSADAMSAGGHYNPEGHQHGMPDSPSHHAGDLGNVLADADGRAHYEITVSNVSIGGTLNPILGRGVIVHAKMDDGGQPTGNAGGRIACGVIGVPNPGEKKP